MVFWKHTQRWKVVSSKFLGVLSRDTLLKRKAGLAEKEADRCHSRRGHNLVYRKLIDGPSLLPQIVTGGQGL